MKTLEEIFLETKAVFARQAAEAADEVLDRIYTEYLPHVETDTQSNQYFQICAWLDKFFSGSLNSEDIQVDLSRYSCEKARQLIYEANKEEITKKIGEDLQNEIDKLKSELNYAYRRF